MLVPDRHLSCQLTEGNCFIEMNVTESLRKSALRSSKLLQSFNPFSAHEDSEDDEEDSLFPKPGSFGAIDEEEVGNDTDEQENMQTKLGKARARHKVLSVFADSLDLHRVHVSFKMRRAFPSFSWLTRVHRSTSCECMCCRSGSQGRP